MSIFNIVTLDQAFDNGDICQNVFDSEVLNGNKFAITGDYGFCGAFKRKKEAVEWCNDEILYSGLNDSLTMDC